MPNVGDDEITLGELKTMVRTFAEARGWDAPHGPRDLAIGLVTEACELLEIFRYRTDVEIARDIQDADARERMADELADTLFCVLRFAQRFDFDLSTAFREKLVKTARKYPARS